MSCWITILFGKTKVNDVNLQNIQFSTTMGNKAPENLVAAHSSYSNTCKVQHLVQAGNMLLFIP
jgi:hypothetical protein